MEIGEFRVVLRAADFERTTRFYRDILSLPGVKTWDGESGRGAVFQAGSAVVEVRGRTMRGEAAGRDEAFDYQGPNHKMTLVLTVPSAEKAYEELQFRDRNIPGGLQESPHGGLMFVTHDPDGVKIVCSERS